MVVLTVARCRLSLLSCLLSWARLASLSLQAVLSTFSILSTGSHNTEDSCREETQGDLLLNLASSAGFPADFPLDAADFANEPGTADKMFSKICIAAQALWKILLEICQKCRYFMVFLSKCCGEELKEKEMVKVPGWFLSNMMAPHQFLSLLCINSK